MREDNSLSSENTANDEKHVFGRLTSISLYQKEGWFQEVCEVLFKLERRGTTISMEVYFGFIHFISCLYVLAVIPQQLEAAGYNPNDTIVSVALSTGIGSVFGGLFANLPFVLAPPTVVSIYLSKYIVQNSLSPREGNIGVILSGCVLMLFGWRPLGKLMARLIPVSIQVGSAVGIGLLTALSGATEIDLVKSGTFEILSLGKITPKICIALGGVVLIASATHYHVKGAFCLGVFFSTFLWWIYANDFPKAVAGVPHVTTATTQDIQLNYIPVLTADLIFLFILYLNGIMTSLSNLAVLTRNDGTAPRGRWVFIMSGLFTVLGGVLSSAPILVSPESSASIKAGAKTGLSTVVCGLLFLLSTFFYPILEKVPAAGTSPILMMIGAILFQNVNRIDWRNTTDAIPAFFVLFFIPFTFSIIQGVIIGYIVHICLAFFSGVLLTDAIELCKTYCPTIVPHLTALKQYLDACFVWIFGSHDHNKDSSDHHLSSLGSNSTPIRNDLNNNNNETNDSSYNITNEVTINALVPPIDISNNNNSQRRVNFAKSASGSSSNMSGSSDVEFGEMRDRKNSTAILFAPTADQVDNIEPIIDSTVDFGMS
eukprot:gene11854-15860_t